MPAYEFKSVTHSHTPGEPYQNVDDTLNPEGKQGWQLVSVQIVPEAMLTIFYLMRQKKGSGE